MGTRAVDRFLRPVSYQNFLDADLTAELQAANLLKIAGWRMENRFCLDPSFLLHGQKCWRRLVVEENPELG